MDDLSPFCCQNSHCPDHGRRGGGNLSVCDRYGNDTFDTRHELSHRQIEVILAGGLINHARMSRNT